MTRIENLIADLRARYTKRKSWAGPGPKWARNTWVVPTEGGGFGLRFWNTDVVSLSPDGWVTLRTGNWWTKTTQDRMDALLEPLGFRVCGMWSTSRRVAKPWRLEKRVAGGWVKVADIVTPFRFNAND